MFSDSSMIMSIAFRSASRTDEPTIKSIVRRARLHPFNLHWQNFIVALDGSMIVGVGQIKEHGDGSRELASMAILPAYQKKGIGSEIIRRLITPDEGTLYLMCPDFRESFYNRFDFQSITGSEIPSSLRGWVRLGKLISRIMTLFGSEGFTILAMKREP
jgi:N-acetylglutamate synthase-like GNAT family acetyltransferase